MNHKGFTTLEAIASLFIISLVLFASITILIDNRKSAESTNQRLLAFQISENIQASITNDITYQEMNQWLGGVTKVLTKDNCPLSGSPVDCLVFEQDAFSTLIEITFLPPSIDDTTYQVIHYDITILYSPTKQISLGGLIYE